MSRDHDMDGWLGAHEGELVAIRREIHAHPELSGEEHETTRLVSDHLRAAGLRPQPLSSGTGLICDIGGSGPVLALRADLDALAMADQKTGPVRSRRDGIAHACGHDVHTTIVLGAGLHLARRWPTDGARLRLIFQPAEERMPGGALDVIADGGLEDVDVIYGLHCEPKMHTGTVGLRTGPITSATDALTIRLSGPGGHTARPHLTVDLVRLAADVARDLPGRVQVRAGPTPITFVFGAIHAGDAPNVIPTDAELRGVIRTQSPDLWLELADLVETELAAMIDDDRAGCDLAYVRGVPAVVNDSGAVARARDAVTRSLGDDAVVEAPQSWGGDDFGWYTHHVPGAYLRLGTHDPAASGDEMVDLHAGRFDVDEASIGIGVRSLVAIADDWLAAQSLA